MMANILLDTRTVDRYKQRITVLEDKLLHSDCKEIEACYRKIEVLEQDNHALREQRDIAVRQLSEMQTENEQLRAQCGLFHDEKACLLNRIAKLDAQCSDGEIAKTKQALNHWRDKAERLKQENERLKVELGDCKTAHYSSNPADWQRQIEQMIINRTLERAAEIVEYRIDIEAGSDSAQDACERAARAIRAEMEK
jgi:cell shape-determining protein MreC